MEYLNFHKSPRLILEITWILANLSSGPYTLVNSIINSGGLTKLLLILDYYVYADIFENIIWVFGNLASLSVANRDLIVSMNFFQKCIETFYNPCLDAE
jgi:hypothetical protein